MSIWTAKVHELCAAQARQLAEILLDIDIDEGKLGESKLHIASPAGSEKKLRGIPVVGAKGVGGTIAGTNPLSALLSKERWRDRIAS